jgi:hypothetical protein
MGIVDFTVAALFAVAGIAAAIGGGMMLSTAHRHVVIVAFLIASACLWIAGVLWAVNASESTMTIRYLVAAAVGACSAMLAVWAFAQTAMPAAQTDIAQTNTQNNQTGPNVNIPGNNNSVTITQSPNPSTEKGEIIQAGIVVGRTFGARRLPSDATMYEFAEIMNCSQFNTGASFSYNGVRLQFISERTSTMLDIARAQDSPIRYGVLARVLE